jgi:hypothetical protein
MLVTAADRPQLPQHGENLACLQRSLSSPHATATTGAPEPWVTASTAAEFLSIAERRVMAKARAGELLAHPFPGKQRRTWLFLLSELDARMRAQSAQSTIRGSPCDPEEQIQWQAGQ